MDIEGQLTPPAQINVILGDTCSQIRDGDTVIISAMTDFDEISICRGLELNLNIRDPIGTAITSLHPLNNLTVSYIV